MGKVTNVVNESNVSDPELQAYRIIRRLLDGNSTDGISADGCGGHAESVQALIDAYDVGGTKAVKKAFSALSRAKSDLATLISEYREDGDHEYPVLPVSSFQLLPKCLQENISYFDQWYERDVYLTGLLGVLSVCMPNVRFLHDKREYSPHLYVFILADAASGKGVLSHTIRWAEGIDDLLLKESQERRREWQTQKDTYEKKVRESKKGTADGLINKDISLSKPPGPEPPETCLIAGEDTTSAALAIRLRDNPYGTLMISTEADAVSVANSREHGNFSSMFRRAFHHERISIDRKTTNSIQIQNPRLALVLSGTPDQFSGLVKDGADGLYSRFLVYKFKAPLQFVSQRPSEKDKEFREKLKTAKKAMVQLFNILRARETPLYVTIPDHLWDEVDNSYIALFDRLFREDPDSKDKPKVPYHLAATVKRGSLITFKIAIVLCILRNFESREEQRRKLQESESIEIGEDDIQAAIALGLVYTEHSLRLPPQLILPNLDDIGGKHRMTARQRQFFDALPEGFRTPEAEAIAENIPIDRSTMFRWLKLFHEMEIVIKVAHGEYRKVKADETIATVETSAPSDAGDTAIDP